MLTIATITHQNDPTPVPRRLEWDALVAILRQAPPIARRDMRPGYLPVVLRGPTRKAADVESFSLMVYDFDKLTTEQVALVVERAGRFTCLIHTTWSHPRGKANALRVILPLATPIPAARYFPAWELGRTFLGECADRECKKVTQPYFIPCHHPDDPPPSFLQSRGDTFDPWLLPGGLAFTKADLVAFGRSKQDPLVEYAIKHALTGAPMAPAGQRDDAAFKLAIALERSFNHRGYDPETVLPLLEHSLNHPDVPPDSYERFREKLLRVWRTGRETANQANSDRVRQHMSWIGQPDRDHGYDAHEAAYMAQYNHSPRRLLVGFDRQVFALTMSGYLGIGAIDTAVVDAGVAPHPDVIISPIDTPASLLKRYGMRVRRLRYSYHPKLPQCDGNTLTLPAGTRRDLTPERSSMVEEYLVALVGQRSHVLRRWLAWLPHTSEPLAAVFLHGKKNVGKNLFATACGALWSAGPVTLEHAMSTFPSRLLDTPFVFADEDFPKDPQGHHKTADFRRLITTREHEINRKFQEPTLLDGCVRIVLAANNENMFRSLDLTADDIDAIADRILDFDVRPEAAEFLAQIDPAALVEAIPRHALYLYHNERPQPQGRFLVANDDLGFAQRLGIATNFPSRVCEICFDFLCRPSASNPGILVEGGELFVTPGLIKERWGMQRSMNPVQIANALRTVALPEKRRLNRHGTGVNGQYYVIRPEMLAQWASVTGNDPHVIAEALRHDTHTGPRPTAPGPGGVN